MKTSKANFGKLVKSDVSALFDTEQERVKAVLYIYLRSTVSIAQDGSRGKADVSSGNIPKKTLYGLLRNVFGYYSDGHIETFENGNKRIYNNESDNALYKDLVDTWGQEYFPDKKTWKGKLYKKCDLHQIIDIYRAPKLRIGAVANDFYTQSRHGLSKLTHYKGLRNIDSSYNKSKAILEQEYNESLHKRNLLRDGAPEYSKSTSTRMHLIPEDDFIEVHLRIGEKMLEHLQEKLKERTGYFLGNSESHVDLELIRL